MEAVSKQLDENLARLAWSLWIELGVAGLERRHGSFSVPPEELIILTSIHLRLRSFLGAKVRADLLAFLLSEEPNAFSASDLLETDYSKRRLPQVLDDLTAAGIFSKILIRKQWRYTSAKQEPFIKLIGDIPEKMVHWGRILAILLPIRWYLLEVEEALLSGCEP